ncbi:hypothetical protein F4679DRAFT_544184 [Xylaria curta]|nr:hypothetical protein F4679DRAFT_544184 [Xylaria curta]
MVVRGEGKTFFFIALLFQNGQAASNGILRGDWVVALDNKIDDKIDEEIDDEIDENKKINKKKKIVKDNITFSNLTIQESGTYSLEIQVHEICQPDTNNAGAVHISSFTTEKFEVSETA